MRPIIRTLDDQLIRKVLDDAKQLMAEVGVDARGSRLNQRLLDCGLQTGSGSKRILVPPEVVEKAISDTPKSFALFGRDGNIHSEIGGDNVHFVPGWSALEFLAGLQSL